MNKEENNAEECYWGETGEFEGTCTYCCESSLCNNKQQSGPGTI